eukprot:380361_1
MFLPRFQHFMPMNKFTVLLVFVLVGASDLRSFVNASAKYSSEVEKELLLSGKIRADQGALEIQIPYAIRTLVGEFLPAAVNAIRLKAEPFFGQSYDSIMVKNGLRDFMQAHCVVCVTNRNKSKTYRQTSVEFTDFATGQPINSGQTLEDLWVDFHLDTHDDNGLFHEVLDDASNGTHKYKFEIKCPGQRRNRNFGDMKRMLERHSNDKDFLQIRGVWKSVQAELGVSVRSRRSTDKLTFKGRNF